MILIKDPGEKDDKQYTKEKSTETWVTKNGTEIEVNAKSC